MSGAGFLVVANRRAGSADAERLDEVVAELAPHAPVEVRDTADRRALEDAIDDLGDRMLVVVGGDGSLHVAVQALRDRDRLVDTRVGLVPGGTGDDMARTLGLPLDDPREAARIVATVEPRALDLLVDDAGGIVVNAVHLGLGAEAARRSEPLKGALGAVAYPIGAAIEGVREEGWRLDVSVDDAPLHRSDDAPLLAAAVFNGPCVGGGTRLCPPAEPDDGELDVVVVRDPGTAGRLALVDALRTGDPLARDEITHRRGRRMTVAGEAVRPNADGEVSDPVERRTWSVEPGAWWIAAPETRASG